MRAVMGKMVRLVAVCGLVLALLAGALGVAPGGVLRHAAAATITSVSVDPNPVTVGGNVTVTAALNDVISPGDVSGTLFLFDSDGCVGSVGGSQPMSFDSSSNTLSATVTAPFAAGQHSVEVDVSESGAAGDVGCASFSVGAAPEPTIEPTVPPTEVPTAPPTPTLEPTVPATVPTVAVSANPNPVTAGTSVTLTGVVTNPDGVALTGSASLSISSDSVCGTFASIISDPVISGTISGTFVAPSTPGTYHAGVIVPYDGGTATDCEPFTVNAAAAVPTVTVTGPSSAQANANVTITGTFTNPNGSGVDFGETGIFADAACASQRVDVGQITMTPRRTRSPPSPRLQVSREPITWASAFASMAAIRSSIASRSR